MAEVRFKPGDKVKHTPTGDVLTFKEYGTDPWEGWAAVTHVHGNTTAETWWKLEDCEPLVFSDDDEFVDIMASEMKAKLAKKCTEGWSGWQRAPIENLAEMFLEHIGKGDMIDVANFAMFLQFRQNGGSILAQMYGENQPISSHCPEEYDSDIHGRVLVKYESGDMEAVPWQDVEAIRDITCWWRTPDWKPREPLHGETCKMCEHDWSLTQHRASLTKNKWYCDKLKLECLEPHYINGVPCHLAEV